MKAMKCTDIRINMPTVEQSDGTAGWWANYLLQLGETANYDLMMCYLTYAHEHGSLNILRMVMQRIVREKHRKVAPIAIRKAKPRNVIKAVA